MQDTESRWGWLITIGQYFAWFVTSLGVVADALYIRDAVSALLNVLQGIHTQNFQRAGGLGVDFSFAYAMTTTDEILIFVLALVAIAAVITIEYYFRKGRPKGLLWKRIGLVVGIEAAIIIVSLVFQFLV